MKTKIVIAIFFFFFGAAIVASWIIFSLKKENAGLSWSAFKMKYVSQFPGFFQPLVQNSLLLTLVCMTCFIVAGLIFTRAKRRVFVILGILSFVLAFWQLFSLM